MKIDRDNETIGGVEEILRMLQSPTFWVGSGFIGVLMSVLAAYVKEWLDRTVPTWREKRRVSSALAKERYRRRVENLSGDARFFHLMMQYIRANDLKVGAIFAFVLGNALMVPLQLRPNPNTSWDDILNSLGSVVGCVLTFVGFAAFLIGVKMSAIADDAAQNLDNETERTDRK